MSVEFDVVIVGSGPAGVSAAVALIESGRRVLMLDAGDGRPSVRPVQRSGGGPERWRIELGDRFEAFEPVALPSPKFRVPRWQPVFRGFEESYGLSTRNFTAVGSLATGGLGEVWGAAVSCLDFDDVKSWPLDIEALNESYRRIAARVGVSGSDSDDLAVHHGDFIELHEPIALDRNAARLYEKYRGNRDASIARLTLGHARNAVLSTGQDDRSGCERCGGCLWGCPIGSIYSATHDLTRLSKAANFSYRNSTRVSAVESRDREVRLSGIDRQGDAFELSASRVFLACGAIATGVLVRRALGFVGTCTALLSSPSFGFALCLPGTLGKPASERFFGLAALSYVVAPDRVDGDAVQGNLFSADGLPSTELAAHMPLSTPVALRLARRLGPSLLLGNGFISSEYTGNQLRIDAGGALISGVHQARLAPRATRLKWLLAQEFRRLGAWMLPGSFRVNGPGEDVHYAATVPMRNRPAPGESAANGEVEGLPGVVVVDGSALPTLGAKPPTFTIMANADRVARYWAQAQG